MWHTTIAQSGVVTQPCLRTSALLPCVALCTFQVGETIRKARQICK